jgi:mannose-6-phosphate isomerase-like protein (cupin superfamily)
VPAPQKTAALLLLNRNLNLPALWLRFRRAAFLQLTNCPTQLPSLLDLYELQFYDCAVNPLVTFLRRDVADVQPWAETCGQIRPLLEEKDGATAEVHHLQITDAKLHYHQRTDEIYYVLDGEGRMRLDDEEIDLQKDVVVYVPRGVKHKAWGNLKVLVVCIPPGVLNDVHELE